MGFWRVDAYTPYYFMGNWLIAHVFKADLKNTYYQYIIFVVLFRFRTSKLKNSRLNIMSTCLTVAGRWLFHCK
jgi:hypothetical protein